MVSQNTSSVPPGSRHANADACAISTRQPTPPLPPRTCGSVPSVEHEYDPNRMKRDATDEPLERRTRFVPVSRLFTGLLRNSNGHALRSTITRGVFPLVTVGCVAGQSRARASIGRQHGIGFIPHADHRYPAGRGSRRAGPLPPSPARLSAPLVCLITQTRSHPARFAWPRGTPPPRWSTRPWPCGDHRRKELTCLG